MSIETMTKLGTYTVPSGSVTSYTFSNIPQTYTDLIVQISVRGSGSSTPTMNFTVNGVSSGYSDRELYGYYGGGTGVGSSIDASIGYVAVYNSSAHVTGNFTSVLFSIPNYAAVGTKTYSTEYVENAGANTQYSYNGFMVGTCPGTSPVTSISFFADQGTGGGANNFVQYSTFTLYGIKALRTAVGNSIKATGGAISFDGTYVYHAFNTTDVFRPNQPVIADVLTVAGGGASGGDRGGGGGAGGAVFSANQSLITNATYSVTVGAGGAIGSSAYVSGNPGNNSQFGTLTAAIGGGYGGGGNGGGGLGVAGGNGGCGGGAAAKDSTTLSGGTGSQGYNGGSGTANGTPYMAGGGGGMGGAGANGNSGQGGEGGIGTSAYTSWLAATGVGQNVSGTWYIAGGGGGGTASNASIPVYGAPGGYGGGGYGAGVGSGYSRAGIAGTANTGGGGGGTDNVSFVSYGNAGGSGVVIVRYKA